MTTATEPPTPASPPGESTRATARPLALILIAASLPMFMASLDNLVMTFALPTIQADLNATLEDLQWFVNAYTLPFATLMLPASALGDRWGRRRVFSAGLLLFTAASVAAALATSPATLIAARAVQGAGAATLLPLSLALIAGSVSAQRRPLAIGIWGGVNGLGVALGPLVGGAVTEGLDWPAIFWLNVPIGVITLVLIRAWLPESTGRRQPLDIAGLLLAGVGILALVWGVVRGNDDGWTSAPILVALIGGAGLLVAFVMRQRFTPWPMMPLRLFSHRTFTLANAVAVLFSAGVFGSVFLLSQFLQISMGYDALEAGLRAMPWTLAPMVIAPLSGALIPRVGTRLILVVGVTMQAAALAWMAAVLTIDVEYASLVPAMAMAGIGMGMTFAPMTTAVLDGLPGDDHAVASGVNATMREVGIVAGVAMSTAVFLANGDYLPGQPFVDGVVPALWVGAGVLALGAIAALGLPRRGRPPAVTEQTQP